LRCRAFGGRGHSAQARAAGLAAELRGGRCRGPHRRAGADRARARAARGARSADRGGAAHSHNRSGADDSADGRAGSELRRARDQARGDAWAENPEAQQGEAGKHQ
jgi:hypothetical protein